MYRLMLNFLIAILIVAVFLSFFGLLPYGYVIIAIQALLFAALCRGVNAVFAILFKTKPNPESSIITGLILSLIIGPLSLPGDWMILIIASLVAMASKYVITKNSSHIFNPAAFGAVASAFVVGYPASWWVGSSTILPVIIVGGFLVIYKLKRFFMALSFIGAYFGLVALDTLIGGGSISGLFGSFKNLLIHSPLIFFISVMFIEPLTSPQTLFKQKYFGALIGGVLFLLQRFTPGIAYSLELSLLAGNLLAGFTKADFRQSFTLKIKEGLSPAISAFWFEPLRPFDFKPGQYLEYMLHHKNSDNRGVRRYFTIASSPTEKNILITTRFSEPGSTFKKALKEIKIGEHIIASKVSGDFIMPQDSKKKLAFVAGGIGVTPFRSMMKYLLDKNERRDIVILYASKIEKDLVFRELFEEAERVGVKIFYALDERSEKIDAGFIEDKVQDFKDRIFYISGPEGMVRSLQKVVAGMGVADKNIKIDDFPGYD